MIWNRWFKFVSLKNLIIFNLKNKFVLKTLIVDFRFLFTGSAKPDIRKIYQNESEKSEKLTKKFFKWSIIAATITALLKIFESYYRYFILHNGTASFKPVMPAT